HGRLSDAKPRRGSGPLPTASTRDPGVLHGIRACPASPFIEAADCVFCILGRQHLAVPLGGRIMRVMVLVKATADSEAGTMPSTELLEAMGRFNEELVNAGVLVAGEGLHPSSNGKRVAFNGTSRTVIDGPFPQTNELVAGFWLWQVKDM